MKAIALISGGLDSTLAACLIKEQGIEVVGIKFKIPFGANSKKISVNSGIEIKEINIENEFLKVLENPRYGFGANMNPCIDCKILMLSKAKELMPHYEAKFIITGEVLGQRPMSQNRQALDLIAKRANLEGLLLRPLSAKLLAETIPEKEGWVNRDKLLNFSGRSRQPQIELAKILSIQDYAQPAGGCLLTDPEFAKRLKDLLTHEALNLENIELLKIGRHFRLSEKAKLVVGRNKEENQRLLNLAKTEDSLFMPVNNPGPTALGRGPFNEDLIRLSCSIVGRYCDLNGKNGVNIIYKNENKIINVFPLEEEKISALRV